AAVPQVEPGLQVVVVMPGAGVVRPDRDPQRAVVPLAQAHGEGQPGRVAVGRHHETRPVGPAVRGDPGDPAGRLVDDGPGDGDALGQPGTGPLGCPGDDLVKAAPGADEAEPRVAGQVRPVELDPAPAPDDPDPLVREPAVLRPQGDAHADELLDGPGCQPVAADLLPREGALLQHEHVQAGTREVVGGRRAAGPGAHHDDVGIIGRGARTRLPGGGCVLGHRICPDCGARRAG